MSTTLLTDPNLRVLATVDLLLVIMMMTAGNFTSIQRMRHKVFATPEDYKLRKATPQASTDDAVERARRLHQNHVENVLPFFVVSFFYTLSNPGYEILSLFLWAFLILRVLYSVTYALALQPYRTLAFTAGAVLMFAMAVLTLVSIV